MAKAHKAKIDGHNTLKVWGTGAPKREFLFVDDLADALIHLMKFYSDEIQINIGTGEDISIRETAELMCEVVGFKGDLEFDESMPDGSPRKLLNVDRLTKLGWTAETSLKKGLQETYEWYLQSLMN